jgi:hypothetical protein
MTDTDRPVVHTVEVAYFIQSRPAPSQPWQAAKGVHPSWQSKDAAMDRLAARRERQPNWEHRLMERTTTVTEEVATETERQR